MRTPRGRCARTSSLNSDAPGYRRASVLFETMLPVIDRGAGAGAVQYVAAIFESSEALENYWSCIGRIGVI